MIKKHCYIKVTEEFKAAKAGRKVGCNVLSFATGIDGNIYVSSNALNEFPLTFQSLAESEGIEFVWLSSEDFPAETNFIV